MIKILRSEYVIISKILLRKLYKMGCWGACSLYEEHLKDGFPQEDKGKVPVVAEALARQGIICRKKKKFGFKYFLNKEKREKIKQILDIQNF